MCVCVSRATLACSVLAILHVANSSANIQINITVASSERGVHLTFSGSDDKVISDAEVRLYNITEERLKNGTGREFGVRPQDVFLRDPTPYGNLYRKFRWQQVTRRVLVQHAAVLALVVEDVLLAAHHHVNPTPRSTRVPVRVLRDVECSLASRWARDGLPDQDIRYNTSVTFFNNKQFVFERKWRNESSSAVTLPFGVLGPGEMAVAPGTRVAMRLRAKRTVLLVRVTYLAQLTGRVVANYPRLLGTYHFWAPAVQRVMGAARPRLPDGVVTSEVMELKCYTDPFLEVAVFDITSNKQL